MVIFDGLWVVLEVLADLCEVVVDEVLYGVCVWGGGEVLLVGLVGLLGLVKVFVGFCEAKVGGFSGFGVGGPLGKVFFVELDDLLV